MLYRSVSFFILAVLLLSISGCEGCRGAGTLVNSTYTDNEKYRFAITKKSEELFFEIKTDEDIRICKGEKLGIFITILPPGSKLYDNDAKKMLLNFIPEYKKNVSTLNPEKKKNRKLFINNQAAYEAWFMGDLGWTPSQYIMWGIPRKSDKTGFIIVLKCPYSNWKQWEKPLMETFKSFKLIR